MINTKVKLAATVVRAAVKMFGCGYDMICTNSKSKMVAFFEDAHRNAHKKMIDYDKSVDSFTDAVRQIRSALKGNDKIERERDD